MCRFIALATTLSLVLIPALAFAADLTPLEALGKSLYFDKISSPSNMACADCHAPSVGFTGPNPAINPARTLTRAVRAKSVNDSVATLATRSPLLWPYPIRALSTPTARQVFRPRRGSAASGWQL